MLLATVLQRNHAYVEASVDYREDHKGLSAAKNQPAKGDVGCVRRKRKLLHLLHQLKIHQLLTGELAGALPECGGGDVMHQLGERQRVGGGPAAAANRLQRETKQVRGALLASLSAVEEQLSSQRESRGRPEVK